MAGPRIRIDLNSPVPATRQIADGLRVELVEGRLKPGSHLPSVRRVAMELGVHFNTVAEAYRMLAAEGWLDLRHGRGATVVERTQPANASRNEVADYRQRLRELISQMRARGVPPAKIAAELRALAEGLNS
ncbi:MAG: GntR family transcriptional regulator [Acidobacteriia bacterium]|nr:GntR family transcriptional regulator [Terriglobia bacterium]